MADVLICDDDRDFHLALKGTLGSRFSCVSAYDTDEAIALLQKKDFELLLLDVQMRTDDEGLRAIPKFKELDPDLAIVMVSGSTGFKVVREAMRLGAFDYVPKDFDADELVFTAERALERRGVALLQNSQDFEVLSESRRHPLVGQSPSIVQLRKTIEKLRLSPANVLITGETGCGKEIVARQLRGSRPDGGPLPFVAVDSATIQSSMAESLLFGHEKGAFTGALQTTKGIFEEARGGVVYFDEIGNMSLEIQAKLLRVLQEKEVMRLGSLKPIALEFRVVAATNLDLEAMCRDGRFKADLLQRLNVLPLEIPPLRERAQDIPLLVEHFLAQHGTSGLRFTEDALGALASYAWPGNVRELGNMISYVAAMVDGPEIDVADLPPKFRDITRSNDGDFYSRVAAFEKELLSREFTGAEGNVSRMALKIGMDRSHLYTKLKEHGVHIPASRPKPSV
jgi:DNA-binding NtrC family response regulator